MKKEDLKKKTKSDLIEVGNSLGLNLTMKMLKDDMIKEILKTEEKEPKAKKAATGARGEY